MVSSTEDTTTGGSAYGCQIFSHNLLDRGPAGANAQGGVGSVFQMLQYTLPAPGTHPSLNTKKKPALTSGHAFVQRPGQLVYRRSNSPADTISQFYWDFYWIKLILKWKKNYII
jgi:hypothetical protein